MIEFRWNTPHLMEEMQVLSDMVQKCINEKRYDGYDAGTGKVPRQFSCIPFLFYGKITVM